MQSAQKVAQILTDAADYIEVNGWVRCDFGEDGEARCILGAVASACGSDLALSSATTYADGTLATYLGRYPQLWNDENCKDEYEAMDALRHAAKVVANGELVPVPMHVFAEDNAMLLGAA